MHQLLFVAKHRQDFEKGLYYVLPVLLLAAGLVLMCRDLPLLYHAYACQNWPTTTGQITSSCVEAAHKETIENTTFIEGPYTPDISYTYVVDGKKYISNRVDFKADSGRPQIDADVLVQDYPLGEKVDVYYQPGDPANSVLRPGVVSWLWKLPRFGFGLVVAGCVLLYIIHRLVPLEMDDPVKPKQTVWLPMTTFWDDTYHIC